MNKSALVIFKKDLSESDIKKVRSHYDVVIAPRAASTFTKSLAAEWIALEDYLEAGSIYEAAALVEELSQLTLPNRLRISKLYIYEGFELWWIYYNSLYLASCLPYTQHKRILTLLKDFQTVALYEPNYEGMYRAFFSSHNRSVSVIRGSSFKKFMPFPLGILLQIILSFLFLPYLVLKKSPAMIFTGDKFEKTKDYDPRMKYIYAEIRNKDAAFVEFIRSLEPWKTVLSHAVTRRRPVVYSAALNYIGKLMSFITHRDSKTVEKDIAQSLSDLKPEERFKVLLATQYLGEIDSDIWTIRITKWVLSVIGVKSAFFPSTTDRNLHTVIACKLNNIPTVGILHGVASFYYNTYDFLPAYDGEKRLTVDRYGVWSEWWKTYYTEKSRAYGPDQLFVSGPMRPQDACHITHPIKNAEETVKVLFVSEQLAVPQEVLPYLQALLAEKNIMVYVSFRPYRDGFELWLQQNHPEILAKIGEANFIRSGIKEAITSCDVVVGTHSTAVLEALFELKPILFFATSKWGDYFNLKGYDPNFTFYAEDIESFITSINNRKEVPIHVLQNLLERFFGNPNVNGSKWAVEQLLREIDR